MLNKIFHAWPKNQNALSPFLISTEEILNFLYNLKKTTELKDEDIEEKANIENYSFQKKIDTLKILLSLFKSNNINTLFELLIYLYLNEEITDIN